jgi:hypothetical protein
MERVLNAFAKGLLIQYHTEDGLATKMATEEQQEAFKEAVKADLACASKTRGPGYVVTYDYRRGQIRGQKLRRETEKTVESPNAILARVLESLPNLSDGEEYIFPTPTFISFRINEGSMEKCFQVISFCQWINSNLQ